VKPGRPARRRAPLPTGAPATGPQRLQKVLAQAGVASRRAAESLIAAGRVRVDGTIVTTLGTRVAADARVEVDGRDVQTPSLVYVVLNKPDEVVSFGEGDVDDRGRPTVASLVKGLPARVVPVGRLDYHARGVLLMTNDGALAAALTHPRREVPKTYHAKFQGKIGEPEIEALHSGVVLEDGTRTKPALEVDVVKSTSTNTWVQITIAQGLYRQIRRMGDAIGHSVLKLIRVSFAGITANGLRDGEWRLLRDDEVEHLRLVAAGKATRVAAPEAPPAPRPKAVARTKPGPRPKATPTASTRAREDRPASTGRASGRTRASARSDRAERSTGTPPPPGGASRRAPAAAKGRPSAGKALPKRPGARARSAKR